MTFPENDTQFQDSIVSRVEPQKGGGWAITQDNGWSFYVPPTMDDEGLIEPREGMSCRMYGKGIGFQVRGLFLAGRKVFYRAAAEDKEHREIEMYGADAADWLQRWDAGKTVWSISMGGFGPGYEQCIQITTAEILRWYLDNKPDLYDEESWPARRDAISEAIHALPKIAKLGLSGSQYGAAMNLAAMLYRVGPRGVMADEHVNDRHIRVNRVFPGDKDIRNNDPSNLRLVKIRENRR